MARAIDLENTIKELEGLSEHPFVMTDAEIKFFLAQQPTIDPVKHGKWVKMPSKEVEEATWCCSECSYPVGIWMIKENFCPNCGARMDGE